MLSDAKIYIAYDIIGHLRLSLHIFEFLLLEIIKLFVYFDHISFWQKQLYTFSLVNKCQSCKVLSSSLDTALKRLQKLCNKHITIHLNPTTTHTNFTAEYNIPFPITQLRFPSMQKYNQVLTARSGEIRWPSSNSVLRLTKVPN